MRRSVYQKNFVARRLKNSLGNVGSERACLRTDLLDWHAMKKKDFETMNRRDFINTTATSALALSMTSGGTKLLADDAKSDGPSGPPVNCAVIGLGAQGQATLESLAKWGPSKSPVSMICDTFEGASFLKKSTNLAPKATFVNDYKKVLDNKSVQAVFIATPTHKHKQIALDALAAGKHVYLEAPFSNDLDEARAIAKAGMDAKSFLQAGLQVRNNAQALHVLKFFRSEDAGKLTGGRGQFHQRSNWRRQWPDDERAQELNWRLNKETSLGMIGEIGIHSIDTASWIYKALPVAVSGKGSIQERNDGRSVPDTIQCLIEYPAGLNYLYEASLNTSYEGVYEMFYGTGASIQLRDQYAWMFKESDARTLGWEGYARQDTFSIGIPENGTGVKLGSGIALVANASKQLALGKVPGKEGTDVTKSALYQAIGAFLVSIQTNKKPDVGPLEGFQATVVAIKCNEAINSHSRIELKPEWFAI